jgi:hypothetical protein
MGLFLAVLYGCNSPILAPIPAAEDTAPEAFTPAAQPAPAGGWYTVAQRTVNPGVKTKVHGSRYTLEFDGDEITHPITVTIRERDANVVDVELDPDGTYFKGPVTLQINYTGTVNDPGSPQFAGVPPTVYYLGQNQWVPVPGTSKAGASPFHVVDLMHFSRYAMFDGTGGSLIFGDRENRRERHTLRFDSPAPPLESGN